MTVVDLRDYFGKHICLPGFRFLSSVTIQLHLPMDLDRDNSRTIEYSLTWITEQTFRLNWEKNANYGGILNLLKYITNN